MKKPTYREIEEKTGISQATISRILSGTGNASQAMKDAVYGAIKELGFDVKEMERRKPKENKLLVFNIPSIENPFYSLIITGARDSANRNGYSMFLSTNPLQTKNDMDMFVALLQKSKAAGLIVTNTLQKEELERLNEVLPVVQCCECIEESQVPFVTIDDEASARYAVEHLLSIGKRRIALLSGPLTYKYARGRLQGYKDALLGAGLPLDEGLIIQIGEINFDMALSAAFQLLGSSHRPDGFFATSDVYAAAVVKAAKRSNLRVPEDVAVVGFDNIDISSMCTPSITTVNQPRYQMGLLCADMLSERISKGQTMLRNMYLETELIVRESTTMNRIR
jgi:LacI family repressor for deo operon, udp, cdd, tsx, nupC, and nupG